MVAVLALDANLAFRQGDDETTSIIDDDKCDFRLTRAQQAETEQRFRKPHQLAPAVCRAVVAHRIFSRTTCAKCGNTHLVVCDSDSRSVGRSFTVIPCRVMRQSSGNQFYYTTIRRGYRASHGGSPWQKQDAPSSQNAAMRTAALLLNLVFLTGVRLRTQDPMHGTHDDDSYTESLQSLTNICTFYVLVPMRHCYNELLITNQV